MRLAEAYKILEISPNTSPEEAKKKYRELTKKYHPDVNKEPGAEDRFKKINEAYNVIQKGEEPEQPDFSGGFDPFSAFGGSFRRQSRPRIEPNIIISTNITFPESILGVKKEISFNRKGKCQKCDGQGSFNIDNGCTKCKGKGQVTARQGNMVFVQTCNGCMGRTKTESCNACNSSGAVDTQVNLNVTIPGGVIEGNVLRLVGMGNYVGVASFMGMMQGDQFTDVHLHIHVAPEPDLMLREGTVYCNLKISLLEALQGCKKMVKTVIGDREVIINPLSKNGEEILIPQVGINGVGNQKVILDVFYPQDTSKLINLLTSEVS